ncbi:PLP-dependent aminotransferase family protein [Amycolatopsis minnesotensis]|uniref:PLP-dependent aminotransferase family protein n=1 Tax=Amycolatopsis minnesotensis TaxID=337894 RepID=A0ABN2R7G3_9PSEU
MDRSGDLGAVVDLLGDWTVSRAPLYRKLARALERAIRAGDLRAGERLPSERELAQRLAISRATVVAAYDELRGSGMIDSQRGSGTRVTAAVRPRTLAADGRVPGGRATSIFQRMVDGPSELISLAMTIEPAVPELGDAVRELVRTDLPDLLADIGYHPRGFPPLRRAVADYYTAAELPTAADQVLVTTGAQQVMGLVAQMYLRPGCAVVVESPSWPGFLDLFRAAGARLVGVPLDEEGIRPDLLAQAFAEHQPVLLYVMPTYHNPTGTLMSAARRKRVAELCVRFNVSLLEDHAYATSSSCGGSVPPPIAAFAPPAAEVLTVGSLAKAVWAGLRIGWARGPGEIIERLARYKVRADLGTPVLDQALAARLLPDIGEIARARAGILQSRMDHLRELLTEHLPSWRWRSPDGGSALWVELPDTNAQVFAQVALRHGVEVVAGSSTDPTGAHDNYVRLPCSFPIEVLTELVGRLSRAWLELQRHGPATGLMQPII